MNLKNTVIDNFTGLPYADYFKKQAKMLIHTSIQNPVIFSFDISNFKYFNQMYGFGQGDKLIEKCVYRYCHTNIDCILACRIYVDHIIMLVEMGNMDDDSLKDKYDAFNKKFNKEINQEFPLARIRIYMGAFIIDNIEEEISSMIDKAQYARRSIKVKYSETMALYSEDMQIQSQAEAGVIPMFFSAFENARILVYIQPKFSIDKHELIGGEALSRILDAEGNVIPPKIYIKTLEKSGLISRLDNYVIMQVIELQKKWMESGGKLTVISINLSAMDFWEVGFIDKIDQAIVKSGVPTEYFEFELTETIFCENVLEIIKQILFLKNRGYKISMDDFGSGYNSLYMLGSVPVDTIKFDRGFILNSLNTVMGRIVMKNLISTFKDINFNVICEGIESIEEEEIVFECGCNAVQGFLHDQPIPSEEFAMKYLKKI